MRYEKSCEDVSNMFDDAIEQTNLTKLQLNEFLNQWFTFTEILQWTRDIQWNIQPKDIIESWCREYLLTT